MQQPALPHPYNPVFQFPDIPLGYWFYNCLEGIDIRSSYRMTSTPFLDCHLEKDLVVACAVDLALVLNNKFAHSSTTSCCSVSGCRKYPG